MMRTLAHILAIGLYLASLSCAYADAGQPRNLVLEVWLNGASREIVVNVEATPLEGERIELHVAVKDTGIGIPADRVGSLFQSFTQVDASTTRLTDRVTFTLPGEAVGLWGIGGLGMGITSYNRVLERIGAAEQTYVFVIADHGEIGQLAFTLELAA